MYEKARAILQRNDYASEREYADALLEDFMARAKRNPEIGRQFLSRVREDMLEDIEEERENMQNDLEQRLGRQRPIRKFRLREEY